MKVESIDFLTTGTFPSELKKKKKSEGNVYRETKQFLIITFTFCNNLLHLHKMQTPESA